MSRDSKAENTKGNDQETESKEGPVEATNETVVVDINEPVKEINAVKNSVTFDLEAKLATEEEEAPKGERQSCSFTEGDMADSDRLTSGVILSLTNLDIGERPAIRLPFSFLICKYAIDLPSLTLHQMCWSGAEKFQDNLALVDAVNGDSFTFSEARSLARSFGSGLVRMGGQAADVVAIVLPNMPDKNLIMQIVAVLSAGG